MDGKRTLDFVPALSSCGVQMIEQPLPADADDALARLERPIPLCADESCRTVAYLDRLDGKYAAINIKLDKAGGLTEALALAAEAKRRGTRMVLARTCVPAHALGVSSAKELASSAIGRRGPFVPTILRIQGFRVYFWSREPNEPPHVHLDKGGASAMVWLEPVALASNVGFPAHELGCYPAAGSRAATYVVRGMA